MFNDSARPLLLNLLSIAIFFAVTTTSYAQDAASGHTEDTQPTCSAQDRACLIDMIEQSTPEITNTRWRDQTLREAAKTKAFDRDVDGALAMINTIDSDDTKAMTIRGIGMVLAFQKQNNDLTQEGYDTAFIKLRKTANMITDPPSYAIALTYIAMAQAFAGDNDGAWETATDMDNDALRHKAYGETAEIQAEFGDYNAAMKSIEMIESKAFKNKAYHLTAKIFAKSGRYTEAIGAAQNINNAYKKAEAIQFILDAQKPRDVEKSLKAAIQKPTTQNPTSQNKEQTP
jgi:tetratricopeptide (TPR) repeat protein